MSDGLLIRADATGTMGGGHVMRCLALALEWRRTGGRVWFVGHIESETVHERVEASVDRFFPVSENAGAALQVLDLNGIAACWAVVDGYHFNDKVVLDLEQSGFPVLLFHDGPEVPDRPASAILAQDIPADGDEEGKADRPLILAGSEYRLLRPEFGDRYERAQMSADHATVLITFGAADRYNRTTQVLTSLAGTLRPQDTLIVVLGPLNPHGESVSEALQNLRCKTELHRDVHDMASLYRRADLAVSASGGAAWEMAAMGLPAVLVAVADNQRATARRLDEAGAALVVELTDVTPDGRLPAAVGDLLRGPAMACALSKAGRQMCDGKGAERVCEVLKNPLRGLP